MQRHPVDVIIIGAGLVGLTLAHALQKKGISYQVLERDAGPDERANGWGITLQWAKSELQECIPKQIFDDLKTIQVDLDMNQKGSEYYKFFNLKTLERKLLIPAYKDRLRVRREGLRKLLISDVKVQWFSKVTDISFDADKKTSKVALEDGTHFEGKMIVGCDGSNSMTRRYLCPQTSGLQQLPFNLIGLKVRLSLDQAAPIHKIDPLAFQGTDPETGAYLFWITLSTPETNASATSANPYYEAQCSVSWPSKEEDGPMPTTSAARLQFFKQLCSSMAAPISNMINEIPEDTLAIEIKLQDWPCLEWPNYDGRITLAGDAAHAMTMYRGEAANYGFVDAAQLAEKITAWTQGRISQVDAISEYEKDLRQRSKLGVMLSRQACVDAHDLDALRDDSPLISLRDVRPFSN